MDGRGGSRRTRGVWLIGGLGRRVRLPGGVEKGGDETFCLEVPIPLGCGGTFHSFSYLGLTGDFALDCRVFSTLFVPTYLPTCSKKRGSTTRIRLSVCGILHRHRHRSTPTATNGDIHINSNRSTLFPGEPPSRNIRSRQSPIYISPRGHPPSQPHHQPHPPPNLTTTTKPPPTCLTNPSEHSNSPSAPSSP